MNPEEIKNRQKFVEGEPLKDRLEEAKFNRRGGNFIEESRVENIEFDTFFDYENDLSKITASNEQPNNPVMLERSNRGPVVMRSANKVSMPTATHGDVEKKREPESVAPIIMRPVYKKEEHGLEGDESIIASDEEIKRTYDDVVGFKFIRCEYVMKNGGRCRRQAPKNETICSIHKKMLKKISNL